MANHSWAAPRGRPIHRSLWRDCDGYQSIDQCDCFCKDIRHTCLPSFCPRYDGLSLTISVCGHCWLGTSTLLTVGQIQLAITSRRRRNVARPLLASSSSGPGGGWRLHERPRQAKRRKCCGNPRLRPVRDRYRDHGFSVGIALPREVVVGRRRARCCAYHDTFAAQSQGWRARPRRLLSMLRKMMRLGRGAAGEAIGTQGD